ncbi:MAG TPA: RNA polymerase sigma factor [Planctomycetota bacterium]
MNPEPASTTQLLRAWYAGDRDSLAEVLERHIPWIRRKVEIDLGSALRVKTDPEDLVQVALEEFLNYGPRIEIQSEPQFRALMARIVRNVICEASDWYRAKRRDMARERPISSETVLTVRTRHGSPVTPSAIVDLNEREAWLRLGIELMRPEDRRIVILRMMDERSFAEIGEELGIRSDAARMRFHRGIAKLTAIVQSVRRGEVPEDDDSESVFRPASGQQEGAQAD